MNDNAMHYRSGLQSRCGTHKLHSEKIKEMGMEDKTAGISPVGCAAFHLQLSR